MQFQIVMWETGKHFCEVLFIDPVGVCVCVWMRAAAANSRAELSDVLPVRDAAHDTSPVHFKTNVILCELSEGPIHGITRLIRPCHKHTLSFFSLSTYPVLPLPS